MTKKTGKNSHFSSTHARDGHNQSLLRRVGTYCLLFLFLGSTVLFQFFHSHSQPKDTITSNELVSTGISSKYLSNSDEHFACAHLDQSDSDLPLQHQHPGPDEDCLACLHLMLDMFSAESPALLDGEEAITLQPVSDPIVVALSQDYTDPLRGPPAS